MRLMCIACFVHKVAALSFVLGKSVTVRAVLLVAICGAILLETRSRVFVGRQEIILYDYYN